MTNFAALQIAYNSEVCTDNYGNPRFAFLLLYYIPSAKTFLACRQVKDKKAAQEVVENQAAPHHDIRHLSGINIKKLFPLPLVAPVDESERTPLKGRLLVRSPKSIWRFPR